MFLQIISWWIYLGLLEGFCPGHVHLLIENVLLGGAFWLKTVSEAFVDFVRFLLFIVEGIDFVSYCGG